MVLSDFGDLGERLVAVASFVEGDEPLVDCAENDRSLRTPAMGVAMQIFLLREQAVVFSQFFENRNVGNRWLLRLEVFNAFETRQANQIGWDLSVVEVGAVVCHRTVNIEIVIEPRHVVIPTVARSSMHATGAALDRHIVGKDDGRGAVDKRMARGELLEVGTFHGVNHRWSVL